jgi:hypothetical protein
MCATDLVICSHGDLITNDVLICSLPPFAVPGFTLGGSSSILVYVLFITLYFSSRYHLLQL